MPDYERDPEFWALVKTLTEAVKGKPQGFGQAALYQTVQIMNEEATASAFTGEGVVFARKPRPTDPA